jgi:hypothetical protein
MKVTDRGILLSDEAHFTENARYDRVENKDCVNSNV